MCCCSRPTFSIPHHLLLAGSCATENGIYIYYLSIAGPPRVCRSCHTAKGITTHIYTYNHLAYSVSIDRRVVFVLRPDITVLGDRA